MTTRTDAIAKMINEELNRHRPVLDEDHSLQDVKLIVKFRRDWPYRVICSLHFNTEKGG